MKPITLAQKNPKYKTISTYKIAESDFIDIEVKGPGERIKYAINYNFLSSNPRKQNKRHSLWLLLSFLGLSGLIAVVTAKHYALLPMPEEYFLPAAAITSALLAGALLLYKFTVTVYTIFDARYSKIPLICIQRRKKDPANNEFLKALYQRTKSAKRHDQRHKADVLAAELSGLRALQEKGAISMELYETAKKRLLKGHAGIDKSENKDKKRKLAMS